MAKIEQNAGEMACPMPRLRGVKDLDPELAARVAKGQNELEIRTLGHAPELYKRFLSYYAQMHWKGKLELKTKEVARLRIAQLNQCHF
jgi:alkylhydroperoxidase family enzyme